MGGAPGGDRTHNLQRRRLTRYPIAPRVHIQFLCPPGLLRGFAARATASGGANPDRRRRRPLWYPIPPRAHSRKGTLPLFWTFVCARATFWRRAPPQPSASERDPIAPRVHRISSCKAAGILRAEERCRFFGLLSALVRRFRVGRPHDLPCRSAIRSRHECISGVLYHNFGKNALYFAADMV